MIRLIVAGGRDYEDYDLVKAHLDTFKRNNMDAVQIVSGAAPGADSLGERYALDESNSMGLTKFPAYWDKHGKAAGPIRNKEMAGYATHLMAFWDGKSKGTKNMITTALGSGLWVQVVRY